MRTVQRATEDAEEVPRSDRGVVRRVQCGQDASASRGSSRQGEVGEVSFVTPEHDIADANNNSFSFSKMLVTPYEPPV